MGRARDKGPEELNRDTDKRRSGRAGEIGVERHRPNPPVPPDGCSDR